MEHLIELVKISPQDIDNFNERLDVIILTKEHVLAELKHLPLTRAYLIAVAAWENASQGMREKINSLGLTTHG